MRLSIIIGRLFHFPFDQIWFFILWFTALNNSLGSEASILLLSLWILLLFSGESIKRILKTPRPCAGEEHCPSNYDIPSAHTSESTFLLLFIFQNKTIFASPLWYLIVLFLGLTPIFRVLGRYHTKTAIFFGYILGAFFYWLYYFFSYFLFI